ncbi:hypothetical protein [Fibrivirga algicola]|uniref:Uncharacterized protein n=1 Tax=Fibrivirga algicola TaxID=2950420 RepID=A0ABX0QHG9_9BACT|nr:hypothetical protein [Fibrivirga algicola]NID10665.1 hypothetical protein [Fibrivirga algicola]
MATLSHPGQSSYTSPSTAGWSTLYTNFVDKAEFNRFGWAATAMMIQGCLLTPILLLTLFTYGGGDWQVLVSFLSFLLVLIPVLSALPVKYIVPGFLVSAVVHLSLILMNIL